jgi:hypothetical protein
MDSVGNCTPAQVQLFKLAFKTAEAINRQIHTQLESMKTWLTEQYGAKPPTYEQFWSDRDALKFLAEEKGLADDQWVRKPYNMAVKALYGELPVAPTLAAAAQRNVRKSVIKAATKALVARVEARKGPKVAMPKDAADAARQMVAYYGFAKVLLAFSQVLSEYRETAKEAKRIEALGQQYTATHPEENAPQSRRAAAIH